MDNSTPTSSQRLIVPRPDDCDAVDLKSDGLRELSDWIDAELQKLETRFATRGAGHCPQGFYLTKRR